MVSARQYRCVVFAFLCVSCTLNAILYMHKVTNQIAYDRMMMERYQEQRLALQSAAKPAEARNVFGYERIKYDYEISVPQAEQNKEELDTNPKDLQTSKDQKVSQNDVSLDSPNVNSRKLRSETQYDSEQTYNSIQNKIVNEHNFKYIINRPEICKGGNPTVKLLIVVCTGMKRFENRQAIRETWALYQKENRSIRTIFLIGSGGDRKTQQKIKRESDTYRDIVQVDFVDSYRNLSIKSVAALKWMTEYCKSANNLFKSDDDIFVHIPNLVKSIEQQPSSTYIMGHLFVGAKPIQNSKSKWFTPKDHFPEKIYPPYVSGTGYVVTKKAAVKLYNASLHTKLFWLEDIYITGLCARKAEVKRIHHPEFSFRFRRPDGCAFERAVTGHHVSTSEMYKIYSQLRNPNPRCNVKKFLLRP